MTKHFKFKAILPTEEELSRLGQIIYDLDFDSDKQMLNNIDYRVPNSKIVLSVDGNKLVLDFSDNWHYDDVSNAEISVTGTLVRKAAQLHKRKSYAEGFERVDLNTDFMHLLDMYNSGELFMDPVYQRDFVWTKEQKQLYIKNLFEGNASIKPTFVEYSKTQEDGTRKRVAEVLDGKQRIKALIDFYNNEFDVEGLYYKDLHYRDQFFFEQLNVVYTRIMNREGRKDLKLETKIQLFLEINMLGTRMSDEDLKKAQSLLK